MATALRASVSGRLSCSKAAVSGRRAVLPPLRAVEPKQDAAPSTSGSAPSTPASDKATTVKEYVAWGAKIVESDGKISGPEDEKDFWEGESMENFGKVMERFFVPGLIVLGIICGGIAARTYNDDADVFIAPPTGPNSQVQVIPAGALAPAAPAPAVAAGAQ